MVFRWQILVVPADGTLYAIVALMMTDDWGTEHMFHGHVPRALVYGSVLLQNISTKCVIKWS